MKMSKDKDLEAVIRALGIKNVARTLSRMGERGDTELIHANSHERRMLKERGGSGRRNSKTGLRGYDDGGDSYSYAAGDDSAYGGESGYAGEGAFTGDPGGNGEGAGGGTDPGTNQGDVADDNKESGTFNFGNFSINGDLGIGPGTGPSSFGGGAFGSFADPNDEYDQSLYGGPVGYAGPGAFPADPAFNMGAPNVGPPDNRTLGDKFMGMFANLPDKGLIALQDMARNPLQTIANVLPGLAFGLPGAIGNWAMGQMTGVNAGSLAQGAFNSAKGGIGGPVGAGAGPQGETNPGGDFAGGDNSDIFGGLLQPQLPMMNDMLPSFPPAESPATRDPLAPSNLVRPGSVGDPRFNIGGTNYVTPPSFLSLRDILKVLRI